MHDILVRVTDTYAETIRSLSLSLSLSLSVALTLGSFLALGVPLAAQAMLYLPGATLDPACAPTDTNCGISTIVASSTANSVPYYAANGSILAATSTMTILNNGNIGIASTTPWARLSVEGTSTLGNFATAGYFTATTTQANTFPYIAFTAATGTSLAVTGEATTSALTVSNGVRFLSLATGILHSVSGVISSSLISLTADITGILPIANGGTNATNFSSSNILAFDGTRIVASSTPTASYFIATSTDNASQLRYASSTAMTVSGTGYFPGSGIWNSLGNVGIGTTTPLYTLDVAGIANVATSSVITGFSHGGYYQGGSRLLTFGLDDADQSILGGQGAGNVAIYGQTNSVYGSRAMTSCINCTSSVVIGDHAMSSVTGYLDGQFITDHASTTNNVVIGALAMSSTSGYPQHTVAIGYHSQAFVGDSKYNTSVGYQSMENTVASSSNTAVGAKSLRNGSGENFNTAIGWNALTLASGNDNTCVGAFCLEGLTTGIRNQAIGELSGNLLTTGTYNNFMGYNAGANVTTGTYNLLLGSDHTLANANITTGSNNIILGNEIQASSATASNQLNIGNLLFGTGLSGQGTTIAGFFGVGTSTPLSKLSVGGNATIGTDYNIAAPANGLLVEGNVGIGTTSPATILSIGGVANFDTATSTFYGSGGLNISSGCYAYQGVCLTIGAGAVNSVSNIDGTLTFSPTTGSPIGSLNLTNPNTWTGLQQFNANASTTQFTDTGSAFLATSGGNVGIGTNVPAALLQINKSVTGAGSLGTGSQLDLVNNSYTDNTTAGSGTASQYIASRFGQALIAATNSGVVTTSAINLNIQGAVRASTNQSIGTSYGLYINAGSPMSNVTTAMGMRIDAPTGATNNYAAVFTAGNVGIGVSSPSSLLTISKAQSAASWTGTGQLLGVGGTALTDTTSTGGSTIGTRAASSFGQPSFGFAIATSTITTAANLYISGVPKSDNASSSAITNSVGLLIDNAATTANGVVTNAYGLLVRAPTGATNNYAAQFIAGNVGIGTTSPDMLLSVGSATPVGSVAHFENSTGSCYINPTTTSLTCSSDARLKKNVVSLNLITATSSNSSTSILSAIEGLRPVTYNWNSESAITSPHTGFIAQEVQTIFPDLVSEAPDGFLTMNYAGLTPYLVKAVQELAKQVGEFAQSITTMVLNATTVNTNNLCIKKSDGSNVCITGDQLDTMLNKNNQQGSTPPTTDGGSSQSSKTDTSVATATSTITVSQSANGTISPDTQFGIASGANVSFSITPNADYDIETLVIDGTATATSTTYDFSSVTSNHTIGATFIAIPQADAPAEALADPATPSAE